MTGVTLWNTRGWYVINTENVPTVYLSITDEGITTHPSDTPANVLFRPRIINAAQFSVRRMPSLWVWGNTSTQAAAFGKLIIDNYDGAFDFMMLNDLRDATIILQIPPAGVLGGAATINSAPIVATAVLDDVTMDNEDQITVILKDTIARLDRPLLMKFNPPFVDSGAANRMVPFSLGALHNLVPQLIDGPNRIHRLGDCPMANVTAARDKGAVLDRNATPPQYLPALNNSGIQPNVMPAGVFTVDCSSEGTQAVIPGIPDVLASVGLLRSTTNPGPDGAGVTTWGGAANPSLTAPSGFTYNNIANGTFSRLTYANGFGQDWAMGMATAVAFRPEFGTLGLSTNVTTAVLLPGQTYRISIALRACYTSGVQSQGTAGLALRTDLTNSQAGNISGAIGGNGFIDAPLPDGSQYTFVYSTPNDGVTRTVYVISSGNPSFTPCQVIWNNLKVELLGQYQELPMLGITLARYFREVLYVRAGEALAICNYADLAALDAATQYTFGNHYDDQPNILTALRDPLDSYTATLFADNLGVLRTARLIDPTDPSGPAVIADFDTTNMARPVSLVTDRAMGLTTLMGGPRNWHQFSLTDFVTDFTLVPAEVRARFSRKSQYQRLSGITPAGQYTFAQGAPIFDSLLELPEHVQAEIDRVIAIYAPRVYPDGTISNGRRRFITFTVYFDDVTQLGVNTKTNAATLKFGDIIKVTYPRHGLSNTRALVVGTELFPFAQKIIIKGFL